MVDSTLGNKDQVETSNNNKNQNQGTCASSCGVNQAYVEKGEATGTGSTQVNANHIIQYPRQPKMDDGKWIAIGSLLGALLGKFADNGTLNKAKDAENKWKAINEQLADKGRELWGKMPNEAAEADKADNDLENQYDWNIARRDDELRRAQQLDACNDAIHEKLCSFALCGYTPDYDGITARIKADVAAQTKKQREQLCKSLNRYSARQCCGIETALATAAISTTVGALYKAREDERARAWQINEGLLFKAGELIENQRNGRFDSAATMDKTGINIQQTRYASHNDNYHKLAALGADFLTSAGKNYAWLAESYRKTADKMSGDLANLGALIAVVLSIWLSKDAGENKCGSDGGKSSYPGDPTTNSETAF